MIGLYLIIEELVEIFSISNVENYYKIVTEYRSLQSLEVGRVVKVHRENVATTLNNIRINISEYIKESNKRKRNTTDGKKML